jgi:hypothetical protein
MLAQLVLPAFRLWPELAGPAIADRDRVTAVRRRVLTWPMWVVTLSCLGWVPGGLIFPAAVSLVAGHVGLDVFGHFLISFTVSGLIALTYSFFGVQYAALRIFYPKLWTDAADCAPPPVPSSRWGHPARRRHLVGRRWFSGV